MRRQLMWRNQRIGLFPLDAFAPGQSINRFLSAQKGIEQRATPVHVRALIEHAGKLFRCAVTIGLALIAGPFLVSGSPLNKAWIDQHDFLRGMAYNILRLEIAMEKGLLLVMQVTEHSDQRLAPGPQFQPVQMSPRHMRQPLPVDIIHHQVNAPALIVVQERVDTWQGWMPELVQSRPANGEVKTRLLIQAADLLEYQKRALWCRVLLIFDQSEHARTA